MNVRVCGLISEGQGQRQREREKKGEKFNEEREMF
jgi:hypothetical protein